MRMKITCPHCKRGMLVDESLAGKKGKCKACQQILTIPKPTPESSAPPNDKPAAPDGVKLKPPAPTSPPEDVEAAAAALFADEPKIEAPVEVTIIKLNCPFCDEAVRFSSDLAGKRAPCPECKRVIKVPELEKKEPKDWRKLATRGPTGARLPEQPGLEGAWSSAAVSRVGEQALQEAGVIAPKLPPRTRWQRIRWPVYGASLLLLLAAAGLLGYRWWGKRAEARALNEAIQFADSSDASADLRGALLLGIGNYYLDSKAGETAEEIKKRQGKAFNTLQSAKGSTRDVLLIELAMARARFGGDKSEVDLQKRLSWDDTQKNALRPTLAEIEDAEARQLALRAVCRFLIERGQTKNVLPLTSQVYSAPDAEQAAAFAVVGLELFKKDRTLAEQAAAKALDLYKKPTKPPLPLRAEVVALALLLDKAAPPAGEAAEEKANEHLGKVAALARQEKWDQAKQEAAKNDFGEEVQFRAQLAIAEAAADGKADDAASRVEEAIRSAENNARNKPELSWALLRLTDVALRANVPMDRVQALPDCIADANLRDWAQLTIFRFRLAGMNQKVEEPETGKIKSSVAGALAAQALARHNTRLDTGWAGTVQSWEQPKKAFGSLGVAMGLQERRR